MNKFQFEDIEQMSLSDLYMQLGMADFVYIETSEFLDLLQEYRHNLIKKIKETHEHNESICGRESSQ